MTYIPFFFLFVQFWSPTWILTNHTQIQYSPSINRMNIHGIWPNYYNGSYPVYCPGLAFNATSIAPLDPLLDIYWTNYQNTTEFLEHEWDKHGTCSMNMDPTIVSSVYAYFKRGLQLYTQLNLTHQLHNMYSGNGNMQISTDKLNAALLSVYGMQPIVTCIYIPGYDMPWLDEIRFCYTSDFTSMGCPNMEYNARCNSTYIFVPLI